jgi:magnesium chelatase family protein
LGKNHPVPVNASLEASGVRRYCSPDAAGQNLLDRAFDKLRLSARAVVRILKVARTIADLSGSATVTAAHIAEAIQYRSLDRRFRP